MNRKNMILCAFVGLAAVQIGVPLSMIAHRERTLAEGQVYKFRTAPVDPYDAFRGRYVALRLEESRVSVPPNSPEYRPNQKIYAFLDRDENGFTKVAGVSTDRPEKRAYVTARVSYATGTNLCLNLPFDRYYMSEGSAPKAETAYRRNSTRTNLNCYVTVRILSGFAVLEELYVCGMPIREYIEKEGKNERN